MGIEQRIERLERSNRFLRTILTGIVLVFGASVLIGAKPYNQAPGRIEANEFVLLDKDGKERGALRIVEETFGTVIHKGPYLVITDSKGTKRMAIGCKEGNNGTNEVGYQIINKEGKTQIGASVIGENSQASIYLRHDSGSSVDIRTLHNVAQIEAFCHPTYPAPSAQMFATPDARGFSMSDILVEGTIKTIPEIRMTHQDRKNTITIYDEKGNPVWKQP